jgi:hypothetical protein
MKKYISIEEADALFEKYYDGVTTGAEEKLLQEFLQQEGLPERFWAERALFGYFEEERQLGTTFQEVRLEIEAPDLSDGSENKTKLPPQNFWLRLNPVLKWSFAAAVLLFGVFILDNRIQAQNSDVAYIDGIRCTNSNQVTALALASINQIDLGSDEVSGTVDNMNDVNLVESSLQQFPELK